MLFVLTIAEKGQNSFFICISISVLIDRNIFICVKFLLSCLVLHCTLCGQTSCLRQRNRVIQKCRPQQEYSIQNIADDQS